MEDTIEELNELPNIYKPRCAPLYKHDFFQDEYKLKTSQLMKPVSQEFLYCPSVHDQNNLEMLQ